MGKESSSPRHPSPHHSSPSAKVRSGSPPVRTELPVSYAAAAATASHSHSQPSRTVSIPLFPPNRCGLHTPSTIAATSAASNAGSVECAPSSGSSTTQGSGLWPPHLGQPQEQLLSYCPYVPRAASSTYTSVTRNSSIPKDAGVAGTRPPVSARRVSPPPGSHVVTRSRSCTLPDARFAQAAPAVSV